MSKYLDENGLEYFWGKIKIYTDGQAATIPYAQVDSTSTATVFTATVPGITELRDGVTCMLHNGIVTSASGFTLNVNGLGAKPCYNNLTNATRETTIFNVAYTMLFVYSTALNNGDGGWWIYRGYDANTNTIGYQLRTNSTARPAKVRGYRYRLWFTALDGAHWVPANEDSSTNATSARTPSDEVIDPFGEIIYNSTNGTVNAGANVPAGTSWQQYALALGYSFNHEGDALNLTYPAPVYVKCEPQAGGGVVMKDYTQVLPSTDDGYVYLFLGMAYNATSMELFPTHPCYHYKDGAIRLWTNATNFIPGIESETYEVLLGGEFTVTTATDAEHEHPWARTSITGFPNDYNCRYRVTFDGTSYVVPVFALYSAHYEIGAGTSGYDEFPCVGNMSLFRLTYNWLFVEQQNVPFLLVYGDGTGTAYLDVYTEVAGEHTVLVEKETADFSQIDPYLIYGMSRPPFDYRDRQLSVGTNGISGSTAFAVGVGNTVTNQCSCAVGVRNDVNAMYSAAFGWFNKTGAKYSFVAGGFGNEASANGAFASGQCTTAKGNFSHTEGNWTLGEGGFSHTEGDSGRNYARGAHVEGGGTHADASQVLTHIGGVNNAICTETGKQVTISRWLSDGTLRSVWTGTLGKYAEVIGNGDSNEARSNARTLDWNGNEAIAGSLTLGLGTQGEITLTPAQLATVLASLLPAVSASDNGKVLQVVNGAWAAASLPVYDGGVS